MLEDLKETSLWRFQVLTAACLKMTALWDKPPCSHDEADEHFIEVCTASAIRAMRMEVVRTSKTSVYFSEI
jgi:hypothetical protein